jgi:FlaA1/EpsC-like NDP-sugar epimerase
VDIVIHAAALKQVPASEYNPTEFIDTNIIGAKNLLEQSFNNNVQTIVALSTDKAAAPINLYGATKLCSDKLFVSSNQYYGNKMKASVVRYGNVMNSRGSVLPIFISCANKNIPFPITDEKMTRFNITIEDGVKMIFFAIKNAKGGEIFVPKLPSFKIIDLAKAVKTNCKIKKIGIRAGEKLHEDIITISDGITTVDLGKYYAILPPTGKNSIKNYSSNLKFKKVAKNFSYFSGKNKFLSVSELRKIISDLT